MKGYSCENAEFSEKCSKFLEKLREKSIFVLKLHEVNGPLPHNMEIRVQAGGMMGLVKLVCVNVDSQSKQPVVDDISRILNDAQKKYGLLGNWPYSEIIQSVVQFKGRRRRQR